MTPPWHAFLPRISLCKLSNLTANAWKSPRVYLLLHSCLIPRSEHISTMDEKNGPSSDAAAPEKCDAMGCFSPPLVGRSICYSVPYKVIISCVLCTIQINIYKYEEKNTRPQNLSFCFTNFRVLRAPYSRLDALTIIIQTEFLPTL